MPLSASDLYHVVRCQCLKYLRNGLVSLAELMSQLTVGIGAPREYLAPLVQCQRMRATACDVDDVVGVEAFNPF